MIGNFCKSGRELTWQQLAYFILNRQNYVEEQYRSILDVARAMKDGRYDGSARFMIQGTAPNPDKEEKNASAMGR